MYFVIWITKKKIEFLIPDTYSLYSLLNVIYVPV